MTVTTDEKALDEFMKTITDIDDKLTIIKAHAGNHFDTNPNRVNWSNVGSAKHVKEMLQEIVDFIEGDKVNE